MLLKDKVCVIVGAGSLRGIGYATAALFAEHGARIAVVDIMMSDGVASEMKAAIDQQTGQDSTVMGVRCDISSREDCARLFDRVLARFGKVDCLVNSAAIVKSQPMLDIDDSDFDQIIHVNLKGAFNLCKSALSVFAEQRHGAIVNVASVAAQRGGGLVGGAHYAASKGGVISLTRSIAREFGPLGIRANVVAPGPFWTPLQPASVPNEKIEQFGGDVPLGRPGQPAELASTYVYLASQESSYTSGETIVVSGGRSLH